MCCHIYFTNLASQCFSPRILNRSSTSNFFSSLLVIVVFLQLIFSLTLNGSSLSITSSPSSILCHEMLFFFPNYSYYSLEIHILTLYTLSIVNYFQIHEYIMISHHWAHFSCFFTLKATHLTWQAPLDKHSSHSLKVQVASINKAAEIKK